MSASQPPRPDPLAQGTLARTPFPHVLVYILEKRLTGTLAVQSPGGEDLVVFEEGSPCAFRTAGRAEPLRTSLARLFATVEAPYAFYGADLTALTGAPAERSPLDPLMVLGAGTLAYARDEVVDATLRRFGDRPVRLKAGLDLVRYQLPQSAQAFVQYLRAAPGPIPSLLAAGILPESNARKLLYLLAIVKALEMVDPQVIERVLGASGSFPAATAAGNAPAAPPGRSAFTPGRVDPGAVPVSEGGGAGADPRNVGERVSNVPGERTSNPGVTPPVTTQRQGADAAAAIADAARLALLATLPAIPPKKPGGMRDPVGEFPKDDLPKRKAFILTRQAEMDEEDFFQMLGVPRSMGVAQVRERYYDLAKLYHPDRQPPELADIKPACDTVFGMLTEAQKALSDEEKRREYMKQLGEGGGTPSAKRRVQSIVDAAIDFQKAEVCLKRRDHVEAMRLVEKAITVDPDEADYLAFKSWILFSRDGATDADFQEAVRLCDLALQKSPRCVRGLYCKGMYLKRLGSNFEAQTFFRKAVDLNPRDIDAVRELRVLEMRNAKAPRASKPAPAPEKGDAPQRPVKPTRPEPSKGAVGDLLGRLFGGAKKEDPKAGSRGPKS